jgi:rhodanese-related sulfurtransferase
MKLIGATVLSVLAQTVVADEAIMSAPAAFEAVQNQEMVLIDIRTPGEWDETGVAQGAIALNMHSRDFGAKLSTLFAAQPTATFGLICATGGRTNYVVGILEQNGITGVFNVSEGMLGNANGEGWIARGLPVVTAEIAVDAYTAAISQ